MKSFLLNFHFSFCNLQFSMMFLTLISFPKPSLSLGHPTPPSRPNSRTGRAFSSDRLSGSQMAQRVGTKRKEFLSKPSPPFFAKTYQREAEFLSPTHPRPKRWRSVPG